MMKFQRRILPPQSPSYLEMEEYTSPSSSRQSISISGSASDLSEIGSVYSLSSIVRQRSDSLTNLFNMSEDSTSLSNLSIASYSLSQNSCDNASFVTSTIQANVSPVTISSTIIQITNNNNNQNNNGSDKTSRKQFSSSYRNLNEEPSSPIAVRNSNGNHSAFSRRSGDSGRYYPFTLNNQSTSSSTTSSQKSFPMKTAETVLNTIGINKSTSNNDLTDRSGLIEHDANEIENTDDDERFHQSNYHYHHLIYSQDDSQIFCDNPYVDSSDENELDMISSRNSSSLAQTGRGIRKTVLNNVDRLLNTGSKQIKL